MLINFRRSIFCKTATAVCALLNFVLSQLHVCHFLITVFVVSDYKATFHHFPDFARSTHPIHFPIVTGSSDADALQEAVDNGHYILQISPDQVYVKNRYEPILTKTEYCAGRLRAQECSGRGLCDHATGLCSCFEGYTMEDCSEPEELV